MILARLPLYQAAVYQVYGAYMYARMGGGIPAAQLLLCARMCIRQAKP